jgi:dynein light chain LC8-type
MSETKVDALTTQSTDISLKDGTGPKAIIKNVDMSEEMQQESVDIASAALEKYNIEKDIAAQIKKEFDRRHGPTWHVVVGKNFGSYVTHGMCSPQAIIAPWSRTPSDASRRVQRRIGHLTRHLLLIGFFRRNQALHLLLHWASGHSHLEIINPTPPPRLPFNAVENTALRWTPDQVVDYTLSPFSITTVYLSFSMQAIPLIEPSQKTSVTMCIVHVCKNHTKRVSKIYFEQVSRASPSRNDLDNHPRQALIIRIYPNV